MSTKAEQLISFGKQFIGVPYERGAATPGIGETPSAFDCSSFMQFLFRHVGVELPRSSILQAIHVSGSEISEADIQPGDVIFMRSDRGYYYDESFENRKLYIGHMGIYCGDGMLLHAKKSLGGVVLQKLSELQEHPNYKAQIIKRFLTE